MKKTSLVFLLLGLALTISAQNANDVLAIDVIVTATKTGFFDKKVTEIWRRTFPANQ